jgi:putative transposase
MYIVLNTYMSTSKSPRRSRKKTTFHPPGPHRLKTKPPPPTSAPGLHTVFSAPQLLERFRKLLPGPLLASWLAASPHAFYERAFTPLVTLWYCLFQRLHQNHHLSQIVEDARAGGADRLSPRGKPLSGRLTSQATTSFSDARQRLPLDVFQKTLHHTAGQIAAAVQAPLWFGLRVALLDGSTLRLRPLGDIPQAFPAHRPGNCKKPPYWCVARVVACFALATGALLDSAMGSLHASEQALSAFLLRSSWKEWLLVADRNFGVYSVARAARAAGAHLLTRLTGSRAAKLARAASLTLAPGLDARFTWHPSPHDQCPEGLEPDPVEGRLIVVTVQRPGFRPSTLYLFSTLLEAHLHSAQALAELYGQRWHVELYLRYVKAQMDLGFLECQSADMVRKEWLAGLIAYNLIRWAMASAAALAQVPVHTVSFSRARELLLGWCLRWAGRRPTVVSWTGLLARIAQARLPKYRKPRPSEPRGIRHFAPNWPKIEGSRAEARRKFAAMKAKS